MSGDKKKQRKSAWNVLNILYSEPGGIHKISCNTEAGEKINIACKCIYKKKILNICDCVSVQSIVVILLNLLWCNQVPHDSLNRIYLCAIKGSHDFSINTLACGKPKTL